MPESIETNRLILRALEPADAQELVEVIAGNLDHLRPWLPWAAHEPESIEAKSRRLDRWRKDFVLDREYHYGLFTRPSSQLMGAIGARRNIGAGAASIGYWISQQFCGQGLMTEAAGAVTRLCFEALRLVRCEIHCEPRNVASARIPQRLGYRHALTIPRAIRNRTDPPHDAMFWVMTRSEFAAASASGLGDGHS